MEKIKVPPSGNPNAPICMIGQAPGKRELQTLIPFSGPAGKRRDELLEIVGIPKSDIYTTNVLKEHPSDSLPLNDSDIINWFELKTGGKVWASERFKAYVEELYTELEQVHSNVFVPCGNEALWALTGQTKITKRRGSIMRATIRGREVKVIPIIHPSASLEGYSGARSKTGKPTRGNYLFYHWIRMDLKRVLEESKFPEIRLPERIIQASPSYLDVITFLKHAHYSAKIYFDIEITNEEIYCISFALCDGEAICIPFMTEGKPYFDPNQESDIWIMIEELLSSHSILKAGQNLTFDSAFLFRKYGIICNNIKHDTMIAGGLLFPDFPKGLDFLTTMYTREPYYKDEGKKWFRIGGNEVDFRIYNAKDSIVCTEIEPKQAREIKLQGNESAFQMHMRTIEPLVYMQTRGMRVDVDGMKKMLSSAETELSTLQEDLNKTCGYEINPRSPQQLMDLFYIKRKIKPYLKDGRPTTDITALVRMSRSGVKEAAILLKMRKLEKLKSSYLEIKLGSDNRLRGSMNPITKNGRLSSSKDIFGEGVNVQTLPEIMRQFIVADEGCIAYSVDLSQGENRVVAYVAPEPTMIKAFESRIDVHTLTASLIFGIPFEQVSDELMSSQLGTGEYSQRFWGKKANHSLNYDLGYKNFALRYELPENQARFIVERYHQIYPGVRQYHMWIRNWLSDRNNNRTLINPFGRKRMFLGQWGDKLFKDAYDFIPQSTITHKINEQCMLFAYYNKNPIFKSFDLLNQTHDGVWLQMPVSVGWTIHAEILIAINNELKTPIRWRSTQFEVPADFTAGLSFSKKGMTKLNPEEGVEILAKKLEEIYEPSSRSKSVISIEDTSMQDLESEPGDTEEV